MRSLKVVNFFSTKLHIFHLPWAWPPSTNVYSGQIFWAMHGITVKLGLYCKIGLQPPWAFFPCMWSWNAVMYKRCCIARLDGVGWQVSASTLVFDPLIAIVMKWEYRVPSGELFDTWHYPGRLRRSMHRLYCSGAVFRSCALSGVFCIIHGIMPKDFVQSWVLFLSSPVIMNVTIETRLYLWDWQALVRSQPLPPLWPNFSCNKAWCSHKWYLCTLKTLTSYMGLAWHLKLQFRFRYWSCMTLSKCR